MTSVCGLLQAVEARTRALGEAHPDTLNSKNGLAIVLRKRHKEAEALRLYEEVLEVSRRRSHEPSCSVIAIYTPLQARIKTLGPDHPDTLGSMHNLAIALLAGPGNSSSQNERGESLLREERVYCSSSVYATQNFHFSFSAGVGCV